MPTVDEHCRISLERTKGYCDYRELHEWMDRPERYLGVNHRLERHMDNDVYREFVRKRWGEKAVVEWGFALLITFAFLFVILHFYSKMTGLEIIELKCILVGF